MTSTSLMRADVRRSHSPMIMNTLAPSSALSRRSLIAHEFVSRVFSDRVGIKPALARERKVMLSSCTVDVCIHLQEETIDVTDSGAKIRYIKDCAETHRHAGVQSALATPHSFRPFRHLQKGRS